MKRIRKLAAVVPRFGASIGGGAETLIRSLLLNVKGDVEEIHVFTTCAKDHRTWENFYPEGVTEEDGIQVRRFSVDARDLEVFISNEQRLHSGEVLSVKDQLAWIQNSVNSSSLYSVLLREAQQYDLILYAPYLFGTSFFGPVIYPDNAILVPCLHDEVYAYQPIFRAIFRKVKGVMWNAKPEADLAQSIYELAELENKGRVVGMGFDEPSYETTESPHPRPYLLYSGRKETGKNLHYLFECYTEYRKSSPNPADLVVIGSGDIDFVNKLPEGVYDYGFIKEEEKAKFFTNASLFVQPSLNESFSIVLMEAWLFGAPVLVHGDCAVTKYHVDVSKGGASFRSIHDFNEVVTKLLDNRELRDQMSKHGKDYVRSEYSWDSVKKRFFDAVEIWKS